MKLLFVLVFSTFLYSNTIVRKQVFMGTIVSIRIEESFKQLTQNTFKIIRKIDDTLSTFKENSLISKLNKNKYIPLDALSFEALRLSKLYFEQSDGYFNIAVGSITKDLYRFGVDEMIPKEQDLSASQVAFSGISFDEKEAHLKRGIKVDLGGMGKGFAIDKMSEYLLSHGVQDAVVSASGDIRCLSKCLISVQDPFGDGSLLSFKTTGKNLGISTSGNYNRYVKDKTHNHLINPKTKRSAQVFASITLVGAMKSSALDAYATAASVMPRKKAYAFLDALDIAYIVVEVDGKSVLKNSGLFEVK